MLRRASTVLRLLVKRNYVDDVKKCSFKFNVDTNLIRFWEEILNLPTFKVQSMMLRWPNLQNLNEKQIVDSMECLNKIGFDKKEIVKMPYLLNFKSRAIRSRYMILKECKISELNLKTFSRYVTLIVKKTIKELKIEKLLPEDINIHEELLKNFSLHPDIQKKIIISKVSDETTLQDIRMDLLQQFLFHRINLTKISFQQMLRVYIDLKHTPLSTFSKNIGYLENVLNFSKQQILANRFLLNIDINNVNNMINEIKEIGGINIIDVLNRCPKLTCYSYQKILETKQVLKDEKISNEAQAKCVQVYLLTPKTIKDRLCLIRQHPELKNLMDNSRILAVVLYLNKVLKRISSLQQLNKNCSSLHKLVSCNMEFNRHYEAFGDATRGHDILNALTQDMSYHKNLKIQLSKHPFWLHVPLSTVMKTYNFLKTKFSEKDIFENCQIILYPMESIEDNLSLLEQLAEFSDEKSKNLVIGWNVDADKLFYAQINFDLLSRSQKLNFTLYLLEKNYNFSGQGIWSKQLTDYRITYAV